ncbi:MAG TPA: oligosaccharide flippase family protein [Sphingomicrobium sp.]|nr:oligosaccharide flippase family protein [Sphingomicrobium sp.]
MSIARNTAYNLIGSAIPLAASLITVPIYLRVIGLERYGLLAICWVVLGYMEVFEFGLGTATAQRLAALKDSGDEIRSEIVWGSLTISVILGTVGALLLVALAPAVLHVGMGDRSAFAQEIAQSVIWLSLLVPLTTCYSALSGALQGREEFLRLNLISGSGGALLAVLPLLAAIFIGPQLPVLIVALILVRLIGVASAFIVCRNAVPLGPPKFPSLELLKPLLNFGGWVTGESLVAPILLSAEKLALGWLKTAAAVSLYMIPFNILSRLLMLPQSLAAALIPRLASATSERADQTSRDALRNLDLVTTPLALLAIVTLKPFLIVWIGPTLAAACAPVGILLITGFWFNSCSHVPYARLIGGGRPDLVVKLTLAQFAPYLALLYFAIEHGGVIGAAAAWTLRSIAELLLFLAATRQLRRSSETIALSALFVIAACAIAYLAPFPNPIGTGSVLVFLTISVARILAQARSQSSFELMRLARTWKTR